MLNFDRSQRTKVKDIEKIPSIQQYLPKLPEISNEHVPVTSPKFYDYVKVNLIGNGTFGNVYIYKKTSDNKEVCLKFINLMKAEVKTYSELEHEPNLWKLLNHPNIVEYIDHFPGGDDFIIVMEYIEGTSLRKKINKLRKNQQKFKEELIWQIFAQIVSALAHCHSSHIIHRDINPENILITQDNQIKLIDFGLSKKIEYSVKSMVSKVGSDIYMSPEMIRNEHYKSNTDSWSLGCVLFELMTLNHPFSYKVNHFYKKIFQQALPNYLQGQYSNGLINIVQHMLNFDPTQRTKVKDLENIPSFKKYLQDLSKSS
jgi:NIMA (never in mitosis gene a)-related kinase